MQKRLNFFIVGVQKGGTSALWAYLREHPGLQLPRSKEVHHFDDEIRVDWSAPNHARLHQQFDWADDNVMRGEATPIYSYWPRSLERLQRYNPAAKLIICLRHPTFRAWSNWRMEITRKVEVLSFFDAIGEKGRKRVRNAPGGVHRYFAYVERGFYAGQVSRILRLFPREQVLFLRTDRLWSDLDTTLASIQDHLGVAHSLHLERRYFAPIPSSGLGQLPSECRELLDATYRDDIRETAARTGLDLSDWLKADYQEAIGPRP